MHAIPTQDDLDRIWKFIQAGNAVPEWTAMLRGTAEVLTYARNTRSWARNAGDDGLWRLEEVVG